MSEKHLTLKELPISERPYEKFEMLGAGALSDAELLAVILRSGSKNIRATSMAYDILNVHPYYEGLLGICHTSMEELMKIKGIGKVKAIQVLCLAELSNRLASKKVHHKMSFYSPKSVADYYMEKMRHLDREEMILILFNGKNNVIKEIQISVGTVNQTIASPRELLVEALKYEAVYMIVLHNHPSGDPTPSKQDLLATKKMKEAGELVGIYLSDHIIIGDHAYVSMKEKKMM